MTTPGWSAGNPDDLDDLQALAADLDDLGRLLVLLAAALNRRDLPAARLSGATHTY